MSKIDVLTLCCQLMAKGSRLETETALQSVGLGVAGCGVSLVVDDAGTHLYGKILGNVEVGEFGIDIGIDNREEVDTNEAEDAKVALATIVVLTVLEHASEVVLVGLNVIAWGKEILITGSAWVVIHNVEVGLRVVAVHLVVPIERIGTTKEPTIYDGEFPIFVVIDLSTARKDDGAPRSF